MSKLQMKWMGMLAAVAGAIFLLYPSINWYTMEAAERTRLEQERLRPKWLLNLGLDLKGGTHLLMELDIQKLAQGTAVADAMSQAIEIIRNRVDQFGVAEPLVARQGDRWIVVQLPGITNSAAAKDLVGKTAMLEFRMVETGDNARKLAEKIGALNKTVFIEGKIIPEAQKLIPAGLALLPGRDQQLYVVNSSVPLTGAALESARVETGGDYGLPTVAFRFHPESSTAFSNLTAANVGRQMAIVLDGIVYSAPVIKSRISGGSGIIEGQFSIEEARSLAIVLRAGSLPAPVRVIEERTVGASLGEDSIRSGLRACAGGIGIIFAFFIVQYHLLGIFAVAALLLNLLLLMSTMAYFGSTLTLPGIAGISLNVAMAVDANILILERIREELKKGKPMRQAIEAGYDMSASAIFDSNLTVLAASALLFQFGTGPIKGFAVTLTLGNIIAMFTATVGTRLMAQAWLAGNEGKGSWNPLEIVKAPNIDWIGKRWMFFGISGLLLLASVGSILTKGLNYGIDFTGGTLVEVTYTGAQKTLAEVRKDLQTAGFPQAEPQSYTGSEKSAFGIRLKGTEQLDAGTIEGLVAKLQSADPANVIRVDRKEYVGPSVGRHLKRQAITAILLAICAIVIYVAFRFANPLWGAAGVVALTHDVLATVGVFSLTGKEVDLTIVAAFLTIAGYSINDTIVIFDRMREKMRGARRLEIGQIINDSVNETFSRTLMTNANVLAVVLLLYFVGGEAINGFAFAMVFGSLVGTFSTVAVAAPLIYEKTRKR